MTDMIDAGKRMPRRRGMRDFVGPTDQDAVPRYFTVEAAPAAADRERNLGGAARQLWRRRWLVALMTLTGTALAAAVAWSLPPLYVAETRLLVGVPRPHVVNIEAIVADISPDAERVQNEGLILQSRSIAREVIDELHLADNPDFNPDSNGSPRTYLQWATLHFPGPVAWLRAQGLNLDPEKPTAEQRENRLVTLLLSRLDVAMLGRSYVLSIKAEAPQGAIAAAVANAFAEKYVEEQRQEKIATMDRVDKFMTDRIGELRDEVRRSDQAVEDYRRAHGLYKSGNGSLATQQLTELNGQLMAAQSAKIEADSRLNEAQELSKAGLGSESVPEVLSSPLIAVLKQQLAIAERRASQAAAAYGTQHPAMRDARAESAAISGRLAAEVAKIVDGLARDARMARARYDALLADFENVKAQMGTVNEQSIQLDALERDATVNRNLLATMLNRAKATIGSADVIAANAKIISPAITTDRASYPPKTLLLLLGTLGGLLIGAAIAVVLEGIDRTFRRSDQVEGLTGLPVLAMVPQVRRRAAVWKELHRPVSDYGEALRRLFVGVELSQGAMSPKVLMLSSAVPEEGKSVMAASLGRQLASEGRRVLLIDCDWRSPRLHQIFRHSNAKGLATLLADEDALLNECVHRDAQSGVDVVPAGHWQPHMLPLLGSERMARLLEAFAAEYELVILDSPPVLAAADALALARLVEKVVFVVRWGHTRQEAVLEALKQLLDVQADLAGIAVSRVVTRDFRRYASRDLASARPVMATVR